MFRAIAGIALSALLQQHWALPALLGTGVVGSTLSAGISGAAGGYVSTGTLKGALISSGEAFAFAGIHFLKQATGLATSSGAPTSAGAMLASAGAHGLVGGLASVAGGGSFGSGFLAAGFSDLAGPDVPSDHASVGAVVEHAVTGGIGSVLGGGKFENGAITGAFGYLFNEALQHAEIYRTALGEQTQCMGMCHHTGNDYYSRLNGPEYDRPLATLTNILLLPLYLLTGPVGEAEFIANDALFIAKAPTQVTPGTRILTGQYMNDLGRVEPWEAYYDQYGRLIGRTDFNAGNRAAGIPDVHFHTYEWTPGGRIETSSHVPGVYPGK